MKNLAINNFLIDFTVQFGQKKNFFGIETPVCSGDLRHRFFSKMS